MIEFRNDPALGAPIWRPDVDKLAAALPDAFGEFRWPVVFIPEPEHGRYAAAYQPTTRLHTIRYSASGRALDRARLLEGMMSDILGIDFIATPDAVIWHELTHAAQRERFGEFAHARYAAAVRAEQDVVSIELLLAEVAGNSRLWWEVYTSQPAEREAFIRGAELAKLYPDIMLLG